MSTHNIGFYEDLTKIIFQLSSNMHLVSSAGHVTVMVLSVWTTDPDQVYTSTVCHSVCIYYRHYSLAVAINSNLRVFTAKFFGIQIFNLFASAVTAPPMLCFNCL